MWDDERIDAAIDEAARELTAGDPGPEFRARVMVRIERAPAFSLWWQPLAAGVAVAAIVAIAVMVRLKPDPTYDNKPNATEVRLKPDARYVPDVRLKPDTTYDGRPSAPDATRIRLKPDPSYERKPDAPYGENIEPLTTAPLDLESIDVAALAADESLHIEPLPPAASIAVAPLVAEPEGDRR